MNETTEPLTWPSYVEAAMQTAIYPREMAGIYPALGLFSEIGELAGALQTSSWLRQSGTRERVEDEASDVLWYLAAYWNDRRLLVMGDYLLSYRALTCEGVDNGFLRLLRSSAYLVACEKRLIRDGPQSWDLSRAQAAFRHAYEGLAELVDALGSDLERVARRNLAKLAARARRGTIGGSGEDR